MAGETMNKRGELVSGRMVTVLMHREIIARMGVPRPSEKHFVDHENGDSLDNRRINDAGLQQLQWLTALENNLKKIARPGRRQAPIGASSSAPVGDMPY